MSLHCGLRYKTWYSVSTVLCLSLTPTFHLRPSEVIGRMMDPKLNLVLLWTIVNAITCCGHTRGSNGIGVRSALRKCRMDWLAFTRARIIGAWTVRAAARIPAPALWGRCNELRRTLYEPKAISLSMSSICQRG